MQKVLVGADPELFIKKDGNLVSAHGMLPGTKDNPHKVNDGAVQVDGMAAEFNIDPADSEDSFLHHLNSVMGQLEAMLGGHTIHADPVAEFGYEMIKAQPEEARELGCDPDFNAWKAGAENVKPDVDAPFRTGAGHIHIGVTEGADVRDRDYNETCCAAVKMMDFYLGLPSLFYDEDTKRRSLYGAAGAYRPKPYGFEYRTLSNKWLSSDALKRWVYRNAQLAMEKFFAGEDLSAKYGDIQEIINKSDKAAAKKIIDEVGIPMPL